MALLPAIELETQPNPNSTVIWLHGLGADGNDFAPIVPELNLAADLAIRFIFPHAPTMPVTINGGFVMPAWYDIVAMEIDREIDVAGLMQSARAINDFIDREQKRGIDSTRIIMAGFSQGGAVAYEVALNAEQPLGGLLAMSTYLATKNDDAGAIHKNMPIMIHHGLYDPVVPEQLGRKSMDHLSRQGFKAEYQTYPMEHAVCPEQIHDISQWLQAVLPATS